MASIRVLKPGMLTTVQDLGRWGLQARGVPIAGPMDRCAHRLANLIAGNRDDAATLEVTLLGPELLFEGAASFVVTGAEFDLTLDGRPVAAGEICRADSGATLRVGARRRGARAYLAIAGGLDVPRVLGSRATHVVSRMGGMDGRPLVAGDRLSIGSTAGERRPSGPRRSPCPLPAGGARLRVMLGPQDEYFTPAGLKTLESSRYTITPQSDRMGYRLSGPPLEHARGADIISDATTIGALQVPASGQPILLMADRQTSGGYPKIATVITADLSIAGQLAPGDWVEFEVCTRQQAMAVLIAQERRLLEP